MKVQGSAFFFGKEADADTAKFSNFFPWLQQLPASTNWPPSKPFLDGQAYKRELFTNTLEDVYCGVVLSARATDFNHYINRNGNTVRVETREIGENPPVEVNFFCLNRDSGKGLYSHYYGSYAFGSFMNDLWSAYRKFVEIQCLGAVAQLNGEDDEDEVRARFSLRSRALYSPLYNPREFERLVRELTSVYEVRLTTYAVDAQSDLPVGGRIENVHSVYRFRDAQELDHVFFDWIRGKRSSSAKTLKSGRNSYSGSVLGIDSDGNERTVFFESTLDDMLNFDYDDIGSFDVTQLSTNPCLAKMISTVRSGQMFRPDEAAVESSR